MLDLVLTTTSADDALKRRKYVQIREVGCISCICVQ